MIKLRLAQVQRSIEKQLTSSRFEQVFATDHFCDSHCGIINNDRQLIGGNIVMPPNNEIAKVLAGDELPKTIVTIKEGNRLAIWHTEAPVAFQARFRCRFDRPSGLGALLRESWRLCRPAS